MSEMLSQEEIDALLKGNSMPDAEKDNDISAYLTPEEIDALGEIGNISMGTCATTLFTLLNNKVTITTPKVTIMTWDDLIIQYPLPYVGVQVRYTEGLAGTNLLVLKEEDVKIITDLMMGGTGQNITEDISDLHLSAIGEAMNQMVGSSCTSLSTMFNKNINISPPKAFVIKFEDGQPEDLINQGAVVKIAFKMVVDGFIDSEIMQLIPLDFAKETVRKLLHRDFTEEIENNKIKQGNAELSRIKKEDNQNINVGRVNQQIINDVKKDTTPINVQPVQFQSFDKQEGIGDKENIDLIMDVPLEIAVELGRTKKLIKDILEFGPGSVIELDRLAGEPVDIIVNGKFIAKGEVVVIDESFGVRITDIVSPNKRLIKV